MYGNAYEVGSPRKKRRLWRFLSAFAENGRWKPISISSFAHLQKFEDKGAGEQLSFMDLYIEPACDTGISQGLPVSFSNTGSFPLCKPPFHPYP